MIEREEVQSQTHACVAIVVSDPSSWIKIQAVLREIIGITVGEGRKTTRELRGARGVEPELIFADTKVDPLMSVIELLKRFPTALPESKVIVLGNDIHSLVRKVTSGPANSLDAVEAPPLACMDNSAARSDGAVHRGALTIDVQAQRAWMDEQEIHLTRREATLLWYFVRHTGRVLLKAELLHAVWGPEYVDDSDLLRTAIKTLRRKIAPGEMMAEEDAIVIKTVHGRGYLFQ